MRLAVVPGGQALMLRLCDAEGRPAAARVDLRGGSPLTGTVISIPTTSAGTDGIARTGPLHLRPGWWVITVVLTGRRGRDTVSFNLLVTSRGKPDPGP